jgi:hypothetical protein
MFIDPLRNRAKVCELGKLTSRRLDGPRISVKPIFYVFKDQWQKGLPSDQDLRLIRHYLEHAKDHFKQLLGPDVEAFDIAEALIHQGQYDESAIKKIAEQSLHTPSDQAKGHIQGQTQGQTQEQTRDPSQKNSNMPCSRKYLNFEAAIVISNQVFLFLYLLIPICSFIDRTGVEVAAALTEASMAAEALSCSSTDACDTVFIAH